MSYNTFDQILDKDFSGAMSISKDNQIIFQKAYGYADISNKVNNKKDTKFQTASGCKIFTAVSILQLIEKTIEA